MFFMIRIISRPEGGAPEHIRDEWIGLTLRCEGMNPYPLSNVMTHELVERTGGYTVRWDVAMEALGRKSQVTRNWWEAHVHPMGNLVFDEDCCEIVPD